jgi:LacI family transcriptional regulator
MTKTNRSPTIDDVAQKAGVSIATVSRVINATTPVHPETAQRVQDAIVELNYVPSSAARVLASRKTQTIGLLLPEISGTFFQPMLKGIEAGVREAGYDLLIFTTQNRPRNKFYHHPLGEQNTDGLIVFTGSLEDEELARLHRLNFPVVLLHQTPPSDMQIPVITIENKFGAQSIVEHLIQVHNCRRIAFLQGPEGHEDSEWRERGYREALEQNDIPFDASLVASGGFDEDEARAAVENWLFEGVEIDAVFCGDDDASIGVMTALQRAGKRVPQDIAVVGFDDVPVARFLTPPLTTVRAPIEQIGRQAVMELVTLIRGEHVQEVVLLPVEMVIRESCGCNTNART